MSYGDDARERVSQLSPKRLALLALELQDRLNTIELAAHEPIAIVGMACRLPGGLDRPEAFWRLLRDGGDAITEVPKERWDVDAYYDPDLTSPLTMNTRWGSFIHGVDGFDPEFFGISYREACAMDPQQRLLLEVSWEALERAGMSTAQIAGTDAGVFIGCASVDYYSLMRNPPTRGGSGVAMSIMANRLSYFFDLRGPSMTIDTACSSSLVAANLACQALRNGTIRMALVGGVNLILSPVTTISASQAGMMAPDGRCKTFDERANGYVRSEGCGVVVLKRLSDAVADRDHILAVIRGLAVNQDGRTGVITAPNGLAQQAVVRKALKDAGLDPAALTYIEAHGTGTALGDSIEVEALGKVFAARPGGPACALGSVKTNLGHTEAAAGVTGLIKLVLALQHREIPPVVHLQKQNPHIRLDDTPFYIPTSVSPWPSGAVPRAAGLSSFGVGGTNAHVIIEEAPPQPDVPREDRDGKRECLLPLSATNESSLRALARSYADHLVERPETSIADLCQVAGGGRAHFQHRLVLPVATVDDAIVPLCQFSEGGEAQGIKRGTVSAGRRPKMAFLFTGQGSQYAGMGRAFYEQQPVFREAIERCAEALRPHLPVPLSSIMFPAPGESPPIDETACTQPALFALGYALAELWKSWGVVPDVVMGHSVGEYTAACVAGVFSLEEGLSLIATRGRLMQELTRPGAMALVAADVERVERAIGDRKERVGIAAINGPNSVVVSGLPDDVGLVLRDLEDDYVFTTPLKVSQAFHSPLMSPVLEPFRQAAMRVQFEAPRIPMLSNLSGQAFGPGVIPDAAYWVEHIRAPVRFSEQVNTLASQGCDVFVELGPHDTLVKMARRCLSEAAGRGILPLTSLAPDGDVDRRFLEAIGELYVRGAQIDWRGMDPEQRCRRIPLPTYPFSRRRCWLEDHEMRPFPREELET
ncbi:type I polyketide synthase [Chondromyces crocatus]|uniref:Polyketide synthase n=1 Tax=Chondromyces crocatus TaxID=52 RepID=G4RJB6_CHOCO|nr:type I polyketide synthase [Chondromyces crocatus]AIR74913.1 polyketide synthase [Chondromyces crocatus]AKT38857.1 polyketide synthase [Chondromyces crocatus]CBD77738.1 polyketide synthase [Chondromyces crocatus]